MKSKARSVRKEANGWGSNVWFGDGGNNPTNFQRVFYRTRREIPAWESFESGRLPVVLVQNSHFGGFTAAGVCYCAAEYAEFTRLDDLRPREIYSVATEDLRGVSDIDDYLK